MTAHVDTMVELVKYQENSIVSKLLMNKDTGSVTLFAFDKGQQLSEHTAPFDALVYILAGEAEIRISGEKFLLEEGKMIIMPANKPHAVSAVKKFKMMLIMIKS